MKIKVHGHTIVSIFIVFQPETFNNIEPSKSF